MRFLSTTISLGSTARRCNLFQARTAGCSARFDLTISRAVSGIGLSPREANTPLADLSFVARGQILNELVDVRRLRGGNNFLYAGRGPGVGNVFRDAAGKEKGILGNNGGLVAQVCQFVIAKVNPVEKNAPFRRIVETQQQVDEGRLPCPSNACNTDSGARLNLE